MRRGVRYMEKEATPEEATPERTAAASDDRWMKHSEKRRQHMSTPGYPFRRRSAIAALTLCRRSRSQALSVG